MERLTERELNNVGNVYYCKCFFRDCDRYCSTCDLQYEADMKLKEYEDAEEQGLLVRLPAAEGSTVYVIDYILECKYDYDCKEIERCKCEDDIPCKHEYKKYRVTKAKFVYGMMAILGKTVFLTKEEAEAALERMNENA